MRTTPLDDFRKCVLLTDVLFHSTVTYDDWVAIGEQSFCEFMISVGWLVESSWFTRFLVEALMVSRNERDYGLENQLVMMDWGFDTL